MHKSASHKLLEKLAIVQFATKYNFAPFVSPNAKSAECGVQYASRLFSDLLKDGLIREILHYGKSNQARYNTFYCVSKLGHEILELKKYKYIDPKSVNQYQHESGKIDIALGFLYAFPQFSFELDYNFNLKNKLKAYNPDIRLKMTDGIKTYEYLIEFERTRGIESIYDEKIRPGMNYDFQANGVSGAAKYLYFYTTEEFDVFKRPPEYAGYNQIERAENKLKKLITYVDDDRFLFAPYHHFNRLNEPVFLDLLGAKRKLI